MLRLLLLLMALHHHPKILPGSQYQQNQEIDRLQLPRIVDDRQLHQLIETKELVKIPENEKLNTTIASPDRMVVKPWVLGFLLDMADGFYNLFHRSLVVDSATRTIEQQQVLRHHNRYAASEVGPLGSSHLAGTTVDLAKRRYSRQQRKWIVSYLKNLMDLGLVLAVQEPYCYHVFVKAEYLSGK